MKYKNALIKVAKIFKKLGIAYLLPPLNIPQEYETPEMTQELVISHFRNIDKSTSILVVNPKGYFGNSVKVEIGYAKGSGKHIYFLEKSNKPELDCLAEAIIPLDKLYKLSFFR